MDENLNEKEKEYPDLSVSSDESPIPLNFDYYKKTDYGSLKRMLTIAGIALCGIVIVAGAMKTIDKRKTAAMESEEESSFYDSYPGSPYADDTKLIAKGSTDNGLSYNLYESHVRITDFKDILMPIDFSLPASIDGVPVTEVDYYVFSYCQLKTLTVNNPECIFFDDDTELSPIATGTAIIADSGSYAQRIAEKYGNPFTAK